MKVTGTILCHPLNGCLVYSPDFWNDPAFAISHRKRGNFEFRPLTKEQRATLRREDLPEYPGENARFKDSILL